MKAAVSGGAIVHEKKRSVSLAPMNSSIPAISASTAETPKNQRSPGLVGGVTGDSLGSGASAGPRGRRYSARTMSIATLHTNAGAITVELYDDDAPKTVANF